jgi:predicted TPR repeat methyltransferase
MKIEKYFKNALECQKNEQPEMAITLYKEILSQDPKHLASLYNLATLYGERGDFAQAQHYYDTVIALEPDYVRAYFNSAVCQLQQKNVAAAEPLLKQAVALVPEYSAAQHLLGSLLFKQGHYEEAKEHLLLALQQENENGEILNHLGMACLHLGELKEAEQYLNQSIAQMPYLAEAQYHLGVIHLKRGEYEAAQQRFQGASDRDPNHFGAWYNLGLLYKQQNFLKLADECFAKAQAIQPDSEIIAFLRAAVTHSNTPEQPPEGFVQELFDRYAGYYDAQMREGIDYQVPVQLHRCFKDHADYSPKSLTLIDLGCGTGLAGELFRAEAKQLRGIDLSSEMLALAAQKNIYDDLHHGDIVDALEELTPSSIDAFVAADVLGYLGDLAPLFEKVKSTLKPEGFWVFSIEPGQKDYELSEQIRYTHSAGYIHQLCEQFHFTVIHQESTFLRKEVEGMIFLIKKCD